MHYYPCVIIEDGITIGNGCYSYSYLTYGEQEITIGSILSIPYDELIGLLYDIIGKKMSDYICDTLFIDSIIRNNDRHFYNLSIIKTKGGYREPPIYDNGSALLSNMFEFPIDVPVNVCLNSCYSKPFGIHFEVPNDFYLRPTVNKEDILNSLKVGGNIYFNRIVSVLKHTLEVI